MHGTGLQLQVKFGPKPSREDTGNKTYVSFLNLTQDMGQVIRYNDFIFC